MRDLAILTSVALLFISVLLGVLACGLLWKPYQ